MNQLKEQSNALHDRQLGLLEDYRILRQELLSVRSARLWGTLTYLVLAGATATIQVKLHTPLFYIFLILASLPLIWHTANRERSRIRIAAYIKVVIEPEVPGLSWESYLAEWRHIIAGTSKLRRLVFIWRYHLSLTGIYDLIVLLCLIFLLLSDAGSYLKLCGLFAFAFFIEAHVHMQRILRSSEAYEEIFRVTHSKFRNLKTT